MGDIFCRECALSNILAQKQEIKRLEKAREQEEREAAESQARQDAEAQERAVKEFELIQAGFNSSGGRSGNSSGQRETTAQGAQDTSLVKRGEKRKFSLDEDEVLRNAMDDRAKARKAIEDEKNAKAVLPSFWVPSVTPSSNKKDTLHEVKKKTKTAPVCPSSAEDKPHHYSLHTLVSIKFTEETDSTTKAVQKICPSCKKGLTNASKAQLAKPWRIDPHDSATDPNMVRCYVCDADLTERKKSEKGDKKEKDKIRPGLVELKSDGTGFSASGVNEVKKNGVVFQC
ncbi:putative ring finger domain-containing protein [Phaeoacremonium minimum UCRPA7]|uniref:Putative ring finger domain-containing protein n=1 Tax=Phaeoacremonium minimum (strain UCR-PA7) TaxID=1286976 RepID=R8BYL4_PHAM7|nr:putative ring finger domain-containing protein [Phaeoacremonium minimum UCRPA7]EOO04453.1 putative ring finger domain-containing protein [Phaeoacremonium minimum UCRPA7]